MKFILLTGFLVGLFGLVGFSRLGIAQGRSDGSTAYSFTFPALVGDQSIALNAYAGQVILVVNTASHCGFTGQYADLETLYQQYRDKGFVIIGVPSNQFANQEPENNSEIASFCRKNFGVTFPMTQKMDVIGKSAHPFFQWANRQLGFGSAPKWNFHKILIGRDGRAITYFYSATGPLSPRVKRAIDAALAE